MAAERPEELVLVIADMARSKPPLTGAFVAELRAGCRAAAPRWRCR
jgi:cyclic beta-1,2-glucan synthetase